jgi:hypothetical protein
MHLASCYCRFWPESPFLIFLLKPLCLLNAGATADLLPSPALIARASMRALGGTSVTATPLQPATAISGNGHGY